LRANASTESELQSIFDINLFSLVALTRELLPLLKKSEAGRIVNLASILGSLTLQAMDPSPIAPLRKFAIESGSQRVHDPSGSGTQGHQYQAELCTSGLGQDRPWLGCGAYVCA